LPFRRRLITRRIALSTAPPPRGRPHDGDGFCEVPVNALEGFWSWLRPHRGISQEKLPLDLGFFEFVHHVRVRGKALLGESIALLVVSPRIPT
jgi:hypothetical protein